jgi:Putative homoserine kinase type II (protein kinase fold)
METKLNAIAASFAIEGAITDISPLGNGLINDTFKVTTLGSGPDYVLQRINTAIFRDVELLQHNIEAVTRHIRKKLTDAGASDIDRRVLQIVPAEDGRTWVESDGKFWRMTVLIRDAFTHEAVTPESSRLCGAAFGTFEALLSDMDEKLGETIPDFHNIELRLRQMEEAVALDAAGRLSDPEVRSILADLRSYAEQMCLGEQLHREGKLPKRICHCDTKVNNMLFDAAGNVLCVIDLDTVMPSFVFSDYGDFLRTAANFVAEDDPDISKVGFNMEIFKAFTEGYLKSTSTFLSPVEKENLPYAACLFPYMQAVRFFTDYIAGDTYYKIKYPDHNLVRTRNQTALFHSALSKVPDMKDFIL